MSNTTATATDKADDIVTRLIGHINQSITDSFGYYSRRERAEETRFCVWDGQSPDGRKYASEYGKDVFPWEGSRDARVRLADEIINERVKVLKSAFRRSMLNAMGTESRDKEWGANTTILLKWMLHTKLLRELNAVIEYAANVREAFGAVVFSITWEQELRMQQELLDMQAMIQAAAEDEEMAEQVAMLVDPARDDESIEALQQLSPAITKTKARQMIRELRGTGQAYFDIPEIIRSQPRWIALEPMLDVFFPAQCSDLQRAAWVARRELVDEATLRDRVNTEGYDEAWVEAAVTKRGSVLHSQLESLHTLGHRSWRGFDGFNTTESEELIEVWHVYEKIHNLQIGVPEVYCTVLHGDVPALHAKRELLSYDHGQLPFIESVRERTGRAILDSRGIPEIVETDQADIKTQRDFKSDRSSITILPPIRVPARQAGKLQFGPAAQIPERRQGEIQPMAWPALDAGTREVEGEMISHVNRYWGRMSSDVPPMLTEMHLEDLAGDWLIHLTGAFTQTLQLMQQYMTDDEVARVLGPLRQRWNVGRQEIQGQFDLIVSFDPRDLNTEYVIKKAELINNMIVPLDVAGVLNRAGLVKSLLSALDPQLAQDLVQELDVVTDAEVEDETMQFMKLSNGIEAPLREGGQNAQLRLQTMEQIIQANPAIQQRLQQDEMFAKLVQTRMQNLQFQLQQQENSQIGRIGVQPALQQ